MVDVDTIVKLRGTGEGRQRGEVDASTGRVNEEYNSNS